MRAYKFLATGTVGRFSAFDWPQASEAGPGAWVEARGPLIDCLNGVHACRLADLVEWIDDELWEIELAGKIVELETMVAAERGRLLRRVGAWNATSAQEFADTCAWRSREFALTALRRVGLTTQAAQLVATAELATMQQAAANSSTAATTTDEATATLSAFAADAVALAEGKRPENWTAGKTGWAAPQTPAATAANLGFVVAHAAGLQAASESPNGYQAGFNAERSWQANWLLQRLGLRQH